MRSARCRYLARITGVAIVTDSTSYVPAAAGPGMRSRIAASISSKGIAQSWRLLALAD